MMSQSIASASQNAARDPAQERSGSIPRHVSRNAVGLATADPHRIIQANDAFFAITGYSRTDLAAGHLTWSRITPPDHARLGRRALRELESHGECAPYETACVRKDGTLVPVRIALLRLEGSEMRWLSYVTDIGAERRAEAEQRASEARLKVAERAARMGIFDWDLVHGRGFWSEELRAIYGADFVSDFDGAYEIFKRCVHPEDLAQVEENYARMLQDDGPFNAAFRIVRPDGEVRCLTAHYEVWRDADGRPVRLVGANIDVTALKRAEEERHWAERRLQLAMEAGQLGSWELDLLRNTARRSLRHDQIFGYDALLPEWRYEHLMRHVLPEDRAAVHGAFRSALETGTGWHYECRIRRTDGAVRWIEGHSTSVRDDRGGIVRLLGTIADITERKAMEEELRATIARAEDAARAKSRLIAATTHDLRQPLQAVLGTLVMVEPEIEKPAKRDMLAEAERRIERMADDLDRLMQLSQFDSGNPEPHREIFALDDLLADVVELARSDARQKGLEFDIAPSGAVVYTDRPMLKTILRNLVDNALKYTAAGRIWIDYARGATAIAIAVHDTGVGIPEDKRALIFDEFYRADPDYGHGMGLGLAIVRRIADLLGHSLSVASEAGSGSCFTIQVPLAIAGSAAADSQP